MTIKELIEILKNLPEQNVKMFIDCPNCGHGQEVYSVDQVVTIRGKK